MDIGEYIIKKGIIEIIIFSISFALLITCLIYIYFNGVENILSVSIISLIIMAFSIKEIIFLVNLDKLMFG